MLQHLNDNTYVYINITREKRKIRCYSIYNYLNLKMFYKFDY